MSAFVRYHGFQRIPPCWAGESITDDDILIPGGGVVEPSLFTSADAYTITLTANAAQNATSLAIAITGGLPAFIGPSYTTPLTELTQLIKAGTALNFGTGKFAKLTAAITDSTQTSATVEALPVALVSGDKATYSPVNRTYIPAGTLLGRTYAERDAGTGYGPADVVNDDEIFLLYHDITDTNLETDCELYRHNNLVYENFIPGWTSFDSTTKAKIRSLYHCLVGRE